MMGIPTGVLQVQRCEQDLNVNIKYEIHNFNRFSNNQ